MMAQHDVEEYEVDIECPTCREVTEMGVHDYEADSLPTNLVAQNLVERLEKESRQEKSVRKLKCTTHIEEPLVLYCKTCTEVICRECALYVHCRPDHDFVNLGDFVGKLKDDMVKKMHQLKGKHLELKSKLDEYGQFHQDWMLCTSQAEFWVTKVAGIVQEKIDKDKRQKLAAIKDKQHLQNMLFKNYGDNFGTILQKISKAVYSKTDLDKIEDVEYLAMHKTLTENVEHLLAQDLPSFDHEAWHYSVEFQPNERLVNQEFSLGTVNINMGDTAMTKWCGKKHGVKRPRDEEGKNGAASSGDGVMENTMSAKEQATGTYKYRKCEQSQQTSPVAEGECIYAICNIEYDKGETVYNELLPKIVSHCV